MFSWKAPFGRDGGCAEGNKDGKTLRAAVVRGMFDGGENGGKMYITIYIYMYDY